MKNLFSTIAISILVGITLAPVGAKEATGICANFLIDLKTALRRSTILNRIQKVAEKRLKPDEARMMIAAHRARLDNPMLRPEEIAKLTDASQFIDSIVWMEFQLREEKVRIEQILQMINAGLITGDKHSSVDPSQREEILSAYRQAHQSAQRSIQIVEEVKRAHTLNYHQLVDVMYGLTEALLTDSENIHNVNLLSRKFSFGLFRYFPFELYIPTLGELSVRTFNQKIALGMNYIGFLEPGITVSVDGVDFNRSFPFHDFAHAYILGGSRNENLIHYQFHPPQALVRTILSFPFQQAPTEEIVESIHKLGNATISRSQRLKYYFYLRYLSQIESLQDRYEKKLKTLSPSDQWLFDRIWFMWEHEYGGVMTLQTPIEGNFNYQFISLEGIYRRLTNQKDFRSNQFPVTMEQVESMRNEFLKFRLGD